MEQIDNKYEVIRELGQGAEGVVYLVEHKFLNAKYALKILHKHHKTPDNFKQEAELLLKFNNEGVVQLRDFGQIEDGRFYMATDYCDGSSLKDILAKEKKLEPVYAVTILSKILDVLSAAHDLGIVHRDIKPENIMITKDAKGSELVKVLDFGIAKIVGSIDVNQDTNMGTPYYMSPEQAYGETDLDHRADIYSTAAMGYELLTGAPPFTGQNYAEILIAHVTKEPPGFTEELGIPVDVEKLILRGLMKSKQKRYSSAREFKGKCLEAISGLMSHFEAPIASSAQPDAYFDVKKLASKDKKRILLLDDDDTILNLARHILEFHGYQVYSASSVAMIHQYLVFYDLDLFLTDCQMPDMPGWKVCKMIKSSIPNLKVILFSNLDDNELVRLKEMSGADAWISKRSNPNEWIPKIQEFL